MTKAPDGRQARGEAVQHVSLAKKKGATNTEQAGEIVGAERRCDDVLKKV